MLTEKDYCDYDTCVALKELWYNEKSNWWFNKVLNEEYDQMQLIHICDNPAHLNYDSWGICPKDFVIRPTMWEAQKWLRKEKNIEVNAFYDNTDACWRFYILEMDSPDLSGTYAYKDAYMTYEEALLEGIKQAIYILKEESNGK